MKAVISSFNLSLNNYQARTENDIALSFAVTDGTTLKLGEELEVDLFSITQTQTLLRLRDGALVNIRIGKHDLHDLRLPPGHGTSRTPSAARCSGA